MTGLPRGGRGGVPDHSLDEVWNPLGSSPCSIKISGREIDHQVRVEIIITGAQYGFTQELQDQRDRLVRVREALNEALKQADAADIYMENPAELSSAAR